MIATVTIGTISVQGVLVRLLPEGMARVVVRGRVHMGRLVARRGGGRPTQCFQSLRRVTPCATCGQDR